MWSRSESPDAHRNGSAVFTVTGITGSTTCTASENPVPPGYTSSGCTTAVSLSANGNASCDNINTMILFSGGPVGGVVEIVIPGTGGHETGM